MKILVTGGAGFIGSAVIRHILNHTDFSVVNVDNLTYAGGLSSLSNIENNDRYYFEKVDICDYDTIRSLFDDHQFDAVMNLAAETHVDRSIDSPEKFLKTNIMGTYNLLEAARHYWNNIDAAKKETFRFHHISTDEVFGDLDMDEKAFNERTSYKPNSPYSASKAGSDHLIRAWQRTYGLPTIITNCSNNYGSYQFPEKLIPHMILNALHGNDLPVYGDGQQIRDWLYVDDHAQALILCLIKGKVGETYNIGGQCEMANIDVVTMICDILQDLRPSDRPYHDLITHVTDRPGHDRRYAINIDKIKNDLGWSPSHNFTEGLKKTVEWYLNNESWWQSHLGQNYQLKRIGTGT